MIEICSDFSGVGSLEAAYQRLDIPYKKIFACDSDKFARKTYIYSYGTEKDIEVVKSKEHDFFATKIQKLIEENELLNPENESFLKEADNFAKTQFSFYYPFNVYTREIPSKSADVYVTSPPCQAFSLAGKRLGKEDRRGILFFNSLEFIRENKPRFFIFENVKGLLSHDRTNKTAKYGNTFQEWVNYLGGKSVNGNPTLIPYEDAVPYHIYFKVLNAKKHGVPQNRERVFIVGIRDDQDNSFSWPKELPLHKRLKDVLENEVDEKYFLSEKMVSWITRHREKRDSKNEFPYTEKSSHCGTITARYNKMGAEDIFIGTWRTHKDGEGFRECEDGTCPTIPARAREDGSGQPVIAIKSNTQKGFEFATDEDSTNFSNPKSKTRRGRVGVGVAQTLDTACNQGVIVPESKILGYTRDSKEKVTKRHVKEEAGTITTASGGGVNTDQFVCIPVLTPDRAEKRQNGRRFKEDGEEMFTITTQDRHGVYDGYRIRRLTPTECFRLMDFPDSLVQNAYDNGMKDSQLYKQAGNSIVVQHQVDINGFFAKLILNKNG